MKKILLSFLLLASLPLLAAEDFYQKRGAAIKGYDVVSYFTLNQAIKGDKDIRYDYGGVTWLFSSEENLALFQEDPQRFIPQYGGYCAYAMAVEGSKVRIKPTEFLVVDEKLYLNFNGRTSRLFKEDFADYRAEADKNWLNIQKR